MNTQERYPLPDDERKLLVQTLLLSDALLLALGLIGAIIVSSVSGHGVYGALFEGGALADLGASFTWHSAALIVPFVFIVLVQAFEHVAYPRIESFARATDESRQGVTGELMRLPMRLIIPLMLIVGFAEELAFRYALLGLLVMLLSAVLPTAVATAVGLVASSVAFMLVHTQYRNLWSLGTVFVVGMVLGGAFLATGSLLVVSIAHALYDILELLFERVRMMREDDYFKGKVPTRVLSDMASGRAE